MQYRKENDLYLIALEIGDEVLESVIAFAEAEGIEGGVFSGIGAMNEAEIGWFDLENKEYRRREILGQRELLSLMGNFARDRGGAPIVHCHVVLGRGDFACEGGHLFHGRISVTGEIIFTPTSPISREFNEASGLKLWQMS
ncbi:MAG TPA: DNA-binding protein [candidate division Zixibacteria bacterium]|nr:DNA-binding protein [candidate division Zixibacteria bacterium]